MPVKHMRRSTTTAGGWRAYIKRYIEAVPIRTFTSTSCRHKSPRYNNILMAQGKLFMKVESIPKGLKTVLLDTRQNAAVKINPYIIIVFGDLERIMYDNIVFCYYCSM